MLVFCELFVCKSNTPQFVGLPVCLPDLPVRRHGAMAPWVGRQTRNTEVALLQNHCVRKYAPYARRNKTQTTASTKTEEMAAL